MNLNKFLAGEYEDSEEFENIPVRLQTDICESAEFHLRTLPDFEEILTRDPVVTVSDDDTMVRYMVDLFFSTPLDDGTVTIEITMSLIGTTITRR